MVGDGALRLVDRESTRIGIVARKGRPRLFSGRLYSRKLFAVVVHHLDSHMTRWGIDDEPSPAGNHGQEFSPGIPLFNRNKSPGADEAIFDAGCCNSER